MKGRVCRYLVPSRLEKTLLGLTFLKSDTWYVRDGNIPLSCNCYAVVFNRSDTRLF